MATPRIAAKEFLQTSHKTLTDTLLEEQSHVQDISTLIKRSKDFYSKENYNRAIEVAQSILEREPTNVEALNILTYSYYKKNEEKEAIEYCTRWIAADIQNPSIPLALLADIYKKRAEREAQATLEERSKIAEREAQAKLEERSKIIAEISHSIKNLISTVIDPLENLRERSGENRQVIENALRGANNVRKIVNAMNLSYKGSAEDFYYDARHNTGSDASDLKTIMIESLKDSIGNMFDGKYFSNFMRKYFPTKDYYISAKKEWEQLSEIHDIRIMLPFLQRTFFDSDIMLGDAEHFVIGNAKGSAIKLLILFQELTLNAVKYAAFVPKERRFLRIHLLNTPTQIVIRVENPFDEAVKTKTTGLGHVIVENFARLLQTEPQIKNDNGVYSLNIAFTNFWEQNHV